MLQNEERANILFSKIITEKIVFSCSKTQITKSLRTILSFCFHLYKFLTILIIYKNKVKIIFEQIDIKKLQRSKIKMLVLDRLHFDIHCNYINIGWLNKAPTFLKLQCSKDSLSLMKVLSRTVATRVLKS